MADHQIDWANLLAIAEQDQAAYAALASTASSTFETLVGTCGPNGELDKIIDHMVRTVVQGAPGSHVAREVAGIAGEARRHQKQAGVRAVQAIRDLQAANVSMLAAAAKVKVAHDKVMNV